MTRGKVYLVGAGPGDAGLLTVRALELMQTADVVAYDALLSDAVLARVGPDVELMAVGHRGKGSSRALYRIHPDVIERARRGQRVVRLKQGDPFIFGRGGEEAEELREAGIDFEVVPGVSAALGAAAYAGMPLTHRLVSSDVTFATGHDLLSGAANGTDWTALGRSTGTLVLFMAAKKLRENLERLVASGRSPSTPAAYVASATGAGQRTIVGTLGDLVEKVSGPDLADPPDPSGPEAPALIVIGDVVALRGKLGWRELRPLDGRRILVARARPGASELASHLRELGAEVLEAPLVEVRALPDCSALDAALGRLDQLDGVVFGCAAGVEATLARLGALGRDLRSLPPVALMAVGKQAHARLLAAGLVPAVSVEGACRDAVGAHAGLLRSGRLLVITAEDGRPSLSAELTALGARVESAPAYRLRRSYPRVCKDPFDLMVVPSSSAATGIFGSEFGGALTGVPVVALGPSAEAAARRHGAKRVFVSGTDSIVSAVARVLELLGPRELAPATANAEVQP